MYPNQCRYRGKGLLAFRYCFDNLQQQMRYQRTPNLRFYAVLRFRIEKMQLKILFQFLECQLYCPAIPVNQRNFFC
jgi:hypothetical protein